MTEQRRRTRRLPYLLAGLLSAALLPEAAWGEDRLMEYGVTLASNYVSRGEDLHREIYAKRESEEASFNFSPALQPQVTFYASDGAWFSFWGSFALTDREPEAETGFSGLKTVDEVDTTVGYDWRNRLGAFSAGMAVFDYVNAEDEQPSTVEMFFSWALPVSEPLHPELVYHADATAGVYYAVAALSGEGALNWHAALGLQHEGIRHVDLGLGYDFGDAMRVFASAVYRPKPSIHGYNSDGTYTAGNGEQADYPPTIFWLGISYRGELTE